LLTCLLSIDGVDGVDGVVVVFVFVFVGQGLTMVDDFDNNDDADTEGCEGGHRIRIGIMTFAQHLNYYWVRPSAPEPIGGCDCT
jgi:hypothetical protein